MVVKLYYRDFVSRKLHQINASNVSPSVREINLTLKAAADDLDEAGELYCKPILGLIQGGKA